MNRQRSEALFERALAVIPGGVNSPVRAFKSVGGKPLFITRGEGPYVHDADGHRYIDFVGSWGPLILGHAPPRVVEAIVRTARDGTSFGAATPKEIDLAEKVVRLVPSVERVRFVNSGTEATMSAIRLARAFTGCNRIIKFSGCYHGHADVLLAEAGSGVATLGIPGCTGVPADTVKDTLTVPYNDLAATEALFAESGPRIAAIIVEPAACNMGLVLPQREFLPGLRKLCDKHGALLIFDEVITGFRLGLQGAQGAYGVRPDLTTFGKIIGGGLPVGAYGGRADIMDNVAPAGPVYQAGTLSGNPLAMAAGLATLDALEEPGFYEGLERKGQMLELLLAPALAQSGAARLSRVGSVFHLWFNAGAVRAPRNYHEIREANTAAFARFFHALLDQGVVIAPSAFEVGFISAAHSDEHIESTATAMARVFEQL